MIPGAQILLTSKEKELANEHAVTVPMQVSPIFGDG